MGKWTAAQLNVTAVTGIHTLVPRVTYPVLYPTELTPHPALGLGGNDNDNSFFWGCTVLLTMQDIIIDLVVLVQ